MGIEDFNDRMGANLPLEESDTLGGFVFGLLGHQPDEGESAVFDGLEFTVEATDGRRVQKVRVSRVFRPETLTESEEGAPPPNGDTSGNSNGNRTHPQEPGITNGTAAHR